MAVVNQPVPVQHYLRQPQRLVSALAASSQIEQLGDGLFRLKMRPLTFMMLSLQPIVDMRVWAEPDGTVRLQSVNCEIRGIEYINQRFSLALVGKLQPQQTGTETTLKGRADLEVKVDLPPAFLLTPRSLLETTGNGLLKSVLLTVKQRLIHHLVSDYYVWAAAGGGNAEEAPMSPGLSPNPPIA